MEMISSKMYGQDALHSPKMCVQGYDRYFIGYMVLFMVSNTHFYIK